MSDFRKRNPERPPMPVKEQYEPDNGMAYGCLVFFVIGAATLLIGEASPKVLFIFFIGSFVLGPLISSFEDSKNEKEKKRIEDEYRNAMQHYQNTTLSEYERKLQEVRMYNSHANINKVKAEKLREFGPRITRPHKCHNLTDYKVGLVEDYFYQILRTSMGEKLIHNNVELRIYGNRDSKYIPDIVLWDEDNSILIDIEIDEPYVKENSEPIHYIGADVYRDEFFTEQGYFVLRFAEEQVVRFTKECAVMVCELYRQILHRHTDFEAAITAIDLLVDRVPKINQWTEGQAQRMSIEDYRDSYIDRIRKDVQVPNCQETRGEALRNLFAAAAEKAAIRKKLRPHGDLNNDLF